MASSPFVCSPNRNQHRRNYTQEHSYQAALAASPTATTGLRVHGTDAVRRVVRHRLRAVHRTVPAKLLKTSGANVRDLRARTLEASLENGTADTGRPSGVDARITHSRDRVPVQDDVIALAGVVGEIES